MANTLGSAGEAKNELLVNERLGWAVRFAPVTTLLPVPHGRKFETACKDCTAWLDACPLLRIENRLQTFRQNCMQYIMRLGLDADVCGKCLKACNRQSIQEEKIQMKMTLKEPARLI